MQKIAKPRETRRHHLCHHVSGTATGGRSKTGVSGAGRMARGAGSAVLDLRNQIMLGYRINIAIQHKQISVRRPLEEE